MYKVFRFILFLALIPGFLSFISCRKKDRVDSSPSLMLSFSTDTVMFDTVLATVGSVTRRLIVHNQNSNRVSVSSVQLAGGVNSSYRINIDGQPVFVARDIEIAGNDSIFIFVKVTVNPNDQTTPFFVTDSIIFMTNGNRQLVQLVACGQNADFNINRNLSGNIIWDSLKAHVIYGYLRVDTGASLTILPGTKVLLHKDAYIAVSHLGTLSVNGIWSHPVRVQGDRLDDYYRDLPGQWDGIYLERGSLNNSISNAVIRNGYYGLLIDSLVPGSQVKLTLDGTVIQNMVYDGIYAYSTTITATNCIIGNCGGSALRIEKGGSYDFRQLTIGNFWTDAVRTVPSLYLSNFTIDSAGNKIGAPLSRAFFGNAIIYGSENEEIVYDSIPSETFSHFFDHCLLKTTKGVSNLIYYLECMVNKDPVFHDVSKFDYTLDSISPAIGKGVPMGVIYDIRGVLRPSSPSLGAYEFVGR